MKANPRDLIQGHYATLVDNRTGRPRVLDHVVFEGLPVGVFAACWILGVDLDPVISAGLLMVSGLLSAFFFQTMLQVAQRSMEWADEEPAPGPDTSRRARFFGEIAANAGYASLVALLTAAVFVVASVPKNFAPAFFSALGLGLAVHLVLVLLMVLVRVFALTQERLTDARTGHSPKVARLPERKVG